MKRGSETVQEMDTSFAHSYECERLTESPELALQYFYYPGASSQGGRDGILAEVRPENGELWLGTFAFGQIAPKGTSGIFTTPNPHQLCVVATGEGYIVSANAPTTWEPVRATPIIDVRLIRAQGLMVFASFTDLVAYGPTGIRWRTKRLTWDNLKITEVTDAFIKGEFWDIRTEATASFTVDLATGNHEGGVREF
jgi:hypothetical protein